MLHDRLGLQVIPSRALDARKIFVVGLSIVFGLSVELVPGLYDDVPHAFAPVVTSSLSLATVLVIPLNLLMRLGIAQRRTLVPTPGPDNAERISGFMRQQAGAWGARTEVMAEAAEAMTEFMENAPHLRLSSPAVAMTVSFDELSLRVAIEYEGAPLPVTGERPTEAMLRGDTAEQGMAALASYPIGRSAARTRYSHEGDRSRLELQFEH